jgi:hypothetical protein
LQSSNQAFVLIPERPSSVFVDATSTHVPPASSLHATDSAVVDLDNDGDRDVAVSVEYGVNRLYLNDGTGRLTYVPGAFGDVVHDSEHIRAADFDRDGNMDVVFVAESDEVHQLFLGDGKGRFKDASERLPASSQGNALAVGDVNDDGLPDILIGSTGETGHSPDAKIVPARNLLFLNRSDRPGHFTDVTATNFPHTNDQTEGLALADMDRDSDLDLIVELSRPMGFEFFALEEFLSDTLGVPVELSTRAGMRRRVLAAAEEDIVRVF